MLSLDLLKGIKGFSGKFEFDRNNIEYYICPYVNLKEEFDLEDLYATSAVEKVFNENLSNIDFSSLYSNPHAIGILEKYVFKFISETNPFVKNICEDGIVNIFRHLSKNPAAIYFLEKHLDKVNWGNLCENPAALHILEKNLDKIYPYHLARNPAVCFKSANKLYLFGFKEDNYMMNKNLAFNPAIKFVPEILDRLKKSNNKIVKLHLQHNNIFN